MWREIYMLSLGMPPSTYTYLGLAKDATSQGLSSDPFKIVPRAGTL